MDEQERMNRIFEMIPKVRNERWSKLPWYKRWCKRLTGPGYSEEIEIMNEAIHRVYQG